MMAAFLLPVMMIVARPSVSEAKQGHILRFSGVPLAQGNAIRRKFPFVFEREISLGEVDEVVRFLMASGNFSNVDVVERENSPGELLLVASLLRRIQDIKVQGNRNISTADVLQTLGIAPGQAFERKNLITAADDLRVAYENMGYHGAKVEIEFDLPNDSEVKIRVTIKEGEPLKITEATVETPNRELAKKLQRIAHSLSGHVLTEDELAAFQKEAAEYLQDHRYLTARLSPPSITYNADRTQAKLVYAVENPIRFEFRLEGNSRLTDGTLISALEEERLAGATASPAPDMADRIRRLYRSEGYANAEVSYTEELNEDIFRQLIRFKIVENPRVRIEKIQITGNVSRPEEFYTQFIKSTSSDLIGSGYYNRKDIDDGCEKLITELQNQGYLRAKILSQRADYSKDKTSVVISLNIDEGPLTQVRQIRFEGANAYPRARLLELLKIKQNAALSLKDLEESIGDLKEFYRSEGFLEMKLLNENEKNRIVSYNDTNTQATIDFEIYEGPRVVVGSIELKNNTFTKDYVILRELTFAKGDILTPTKINDSVTHLQTLGLFSRVTIRTLEEGTTAASRTVIVDVTEADPGLFNLGLGVNNEQRLTFRGYLGLAYRNINGTGRGAALRVDPKYSTDPRISYIEHRIALSYLEPFIFGDRNRGRINLVRDLSFSHFDKNGDATIQEENSLGLLLEKDLTRHTKLTYTAYNFANQLQFNRRTKEVLQTQNIAKTGPLVEFDYRDDAFFPSKGTYSFVNFEYSDPALGSSSDQNIDIHFIKSTASFTHYLSLMQRKDFVWANSLRGGYLANISEKATGGVPAQEAFFLGGRSTIRGFDSSDLDRFPNYIDLGVERGLRNFKVTSDSEFYLIKSEIRFPIYKNFFIGPLGGVIFYDGGAVLLSQANVHLPDPYRHSAGVGLRIATPVGPLNLEYGWKLDRRRYTSGGNDIEEAAGAFHFSIGSF